MYCSMKKCHTALCRCFGSRHCSPQTYDDHKKYTVLYIPAGFTVFNLIDKSDV